MRVVCAWCGVVLSESTGAGPVSHGICASCSLSVEQAFYKAKLLKREARRMPRRPHRSPAPSLPLPGFAPVAQV